MIGKAFIYFNRAEHRDFCFERFRRKGWLYKLLGTGENVKDKFIFKVEGKIKRI